jgi:transposase
MDFGQGDATNRYPYYRSEDSEEWWDYDEALQVLNRSRKDGYPHIPTFAQRMLERLKEVGLLHRTDTKAPSNVRKVRAHKKQDLWIRFDTRREYDEGYMAVEVVEAPRSDTAILAAMVAWLARPIDFEQVLEAQRFLHSPEEKALEEKFEALDQRLHGAQDVSLEDCVEGVKLSTYKIAKLSPLKHMDYILPLLCYYKRDMPRSPQEMEDLLEKTCYYINNFLESLRKLQAFLEYGTPNRKLAPAIKEPNREVRAAILHEVDGLNYRQIGERMGIPLPPDFEIKGEHQTIRKMVKRGRRILLAAFGEEAWRKRVEAMKAEKAWWQSLLRDKQYAQWDEEITALYYEDIPIEEAQQFVERCNRSIRSHKTSRSDR